jgi:hypothetical protein
MEKTNVNLLKSLHQLGGELNVTKLKKPSHNWERGDHISGGRGILKDREI